jgi:peptide/nickel transport system substrate-binding protein
MRIDFRKFGRIALFALPLTLIFAIACGGETVTVVETVIVEKEVKGDTVVETVIVTEKGDTITVKGDTVVETVIVTEKGDTVVVTEKGDTIVQTVIVAATAGPSVAVAPVRTDKRFGGELKVALGAAISTLDVHRTTGTTANTIAYAVQEFLFAYDEDMIARPMLIDTWSTSSDGMTWQFKLRDGLKFHNGNAVTAENAVKSWLRWAERDNYGSIILGFIDDVYTTGDLTFAIDMTEPTALVLEGMARIGGYYPYVMPPEMYDVPAADGADVMIGTGPYEFTDWVPGDHLLTTRFEDYQPVDSAFSFMAGRKDAFFDTVDYVVIPDVNAKIAALEVGQIDIISGEVPGDMVDVLGANPDLTVQIIKNNSTRDGAWLDNVDGPFTDARVRRAFAMAYPVEDALRGAVGDDRFWTTCPSMMACGGKWGGFADGSEGVYNYRDNGGLEQAKATIAELGLVGTDIIVLQAGDRERFANPAEISRQTLEEIGFNVIFKQTDWATQTNWREKPELWDVFHTAGGGAWASNPLLNSSLAKNKYWNKYQDETGKMTEGMDKLARSTSASEQLAIVKEMQNVFWQDIPYVSFGDTFGTVAIRQAIKGAKTSFGMPINVYSSWRAE